MVEGNARPPLKTVGREVVGEVCEYKAKEIVERVVL